MNVCIIPSYRSSSTIVSVIASVLPYVDMVVVVDDACSEHSGSVVQQNYHDDSCVHVLFHEKNMGVGGAMKTGILYALELGATNIIKVDADGQMDASYIPQLLSTLDSNHHLSLVKGNRFGDGSVMKLMPPLRLFGNSVLTLLVRITSGYWNGSDPTNGYFAIRGAALRRLNFVRLENRFFFEISLLTLLGLRRADIAEIEIPAIYGSEKSNLSIRKTILTFPFHLGTAFFRRIFWQYFIADMNVGSLFLVFGFLLILAGSLFGGASWIEALNTGIPRTPGVAILALLPLIMGFQLFLSAVLFDVQASPRVLKF